MKKLEVQYIVHVEQYTTILENIALTVENLVNISIQDQQRFGMNFKKSIK